MAARLPSLVCEIQFDLATWTDVTRYVRPGLSIRRGRSRDGERLSPGVATLTLDNRDGRFDRENPSSPYYPNVRPARPIRIRALAPSGISGFAVGASPVGTRAALGAGTVDVPLFSGWTEGGPMSIGHVDSVVTWQAFDGLRRLAADKSPTGFGAGNALSGARVAEVLDGATPTWDEDDRSIDPGVRIVQKTTATESRLDHLLSVAESEGGLFFVAADGTAIFRDATYNPPPDPVAFGDRAAVNLLTANQSSVETDLTGWQTSGTGANLSRTTTVAWHGSAAIQVTNDGLWTNSYAVVAWPGVPVTPGQVITVSAYVRAATTPRNARPVVYYWRRADGSGVARDMDPPAVSDSTTQWTRIAATFTAPAGAAYAQIGIRFDATPAGEVHYVDAVQVERGSSATEFVLGTGELGERRYTDLVLADEDALIANAVTVSAPGQADVTVSDKMSQAEFGRRDATIDTILANSADMQALADQTLANYSQPARRVAKLTVAAPNEGDWYTALRKDLWDRIRVRRRTRWGTTIEQVARIEGVDLDVAPYDWRLSWSLAAIPEAAKPNLLNENQFSIETDASGWLALSRCTIARSTDRHYVGSASLRVRNTELGNPGIVATTPYNVAAVTPGKTYAAVVWAWCEKNDVSVADVDISWRNTSGTEIATTYGQGVTLRRAWIRLTAAGTAPAGAAWAVVQVRVFETMDTANYKYLDAASLREV